MKVLPRPLNANSAIFGISDADSGDLSSIFPAKTKSQLLKLTPYKIPKFWSF